VYVGEEDNMPVNVKQLNSLALAYIGDAVYEVHVRNFLIESGQVRPNELHQEAVSYVEATSQAAVVHNWLDKDLLTEEEQVIIRRGRNAKSNSTPKNMPVQAYRYATAFEALIGYHYLSQNNDRLYELFHQAINFIQKGKKDKEGTKSWMKR